MPRTRLRVSRSVWLVSMLLAAGAPVLDARAACQCTRTPGVPSCCDWNCQLLPAGAVCRPPLGPCDVADTCSGTSAACPDGYAPAGTTCSASPPATCSGTSPLCLAGDGQQVGQSTYCAAPELRVPSGLTATGGNGQVALSWTAVLGASRYNVKRGPAANTLSTIASPSTSTFVDTNVSNLMTYYYAVSEINGQSGVESGNSATVSATPAVLPAPPNLVAVAGNAQVALSWSAVAGASSYRVVRSGTTLNAGAATTYTDRPLANGTTYSYYVYASPAAGGEGAHSSTVTATPVGPPAAPVSLTAVASGTTVNLSWPASLGATSYTVLRSAMSGSGYASVASVTGTSYANGGLATGTTFFYVVQGVNAYGSGAFSPEAQATTVPGAPTGVVATGGVGQITVSWAAAAKATSYNLLRSATSGSGYAAVSTGGAATSYVNSGLSPGAAYYYVVEAVNAAGTSARSAQVQATTAPPPPAAPTSLAWSSPSTSQVIVSWPAVSGATSYKLKRAAASGGPYTVVATALTAPSYADVGLAAGTTYYYVASAVNAGGESPNSAQITAVTRPAAPTMTVPTSGDHSLGLSWSAVPGATSYRLKRSGTSGGPYTLIATLTTTFYTNTGLTNGVVYYYVVSAVSAGGEGADSAQVSGRPSAPIVDDPGCHVSPPYQCP